MGPSDRIAAEHALAEVAATRLRVEQDAPIGPWVRHHLHLLRDVNAIGKRDMDVRVPSLVARRTPAPHSAAARAAPLQADHEDCYADQ